MRNFSRLSLLFAAVGTLVSAGGCSIQERQMKRMTVAESKTPEEVLKTAEAVVRERYYQVKVHSESNHLIALSPIEFDGNQLSRDKIEVYVFLENGFWMPKVWVRKYYDLAEPEMQKGGPITGRFPIEVSGYPPPSDDWKPIAYDRMKEQEIRNAILERLKIPTAEKAG